MRRRARCIFICSRIGKKLNFMGNELGQLYEWAKPVHWTGHWRNVRSTDFPQPVQKTYVENPAARRLDNHICHERSANGVRRHACQSKFCLKFHPKAAGVLLSGCRIHQLLIIAESKAPELTETAHPESVLIVPLRAAETVMNLLKTRIA